MEAAVKKIPDNTPPIPYNVATITLFIVFTTFAPNWFTVRNPDWVVAFFVLISMVHGGMAVIVAGLRYQRYVYAQRVDWILWYRGYYLVEIMVQRITFLVALGNGLLAAKLIDIIFIETNNIYAFGMYAVLCIWVGDALSLYFLGQGPQ